MSGEEPPAPPPPATTIDAETAKSLGDAELKDLLRVAIQEALRRGMPLMIQDFGTPPPPT